MDDDLETLLRDHYERAAGGIHADPALVRRYRNSARGSTHPRAWAGVRGWAVPALAAFATAIAIMLTVVALLRPSAQPAVPRPAVPPASPRTSTPTPDSTPTPVPSPSRSSGPGDLDQPVGPVPTVPEPEGTPGGAATPTPVPEAEETPSWAATPPAVRRDRPPETVSPRASG
jgi:hypothetical protein